MVYLLVVALMTGYQAGKAAKAAEVHSDGKICFDQEYQDRKAGCYELK